MDTLNKKIVIATHYLVYGAPQALRDYLIINKIEKLFYISHPLFSDETKSFSELILGGKVIKKNVSKIRSTVYILNYFIEFLQSLIWVNKNSDKFDLFIGVDALNCFSGIILKKLGKVNKVIFYTIDYVPQRYKNNVLNNIYHWFDKFCLTNADETWNVSPKIAIGREKIRGLNQTIYNRQKIVPIGIWFDKVKRLPIDKINRHQAFFLGYLAEKQGLQLVIDAIPIILKYIKDFKLLIVGGGEYEKQLHSQINNLNINKYIIFTGWIKDRVKLNAIMADSALAVAMYYPSKNNFTYYSDPSKLKDYLSAGLPIIMTNVPYNSKILKDKGCAVIINYDSNELAKTIIDIMQDKQQLIKMKENAIKYAKICDWNIIFKRALSQI